MFQHRIFESDRVTAITFKGRLGYDDRDKLREIFEQFIQQGAVQLIVDVRDVELNRDAVATLYYGTAGYRALGGRLHIVILRDKQATLHHMGFDRADTLGLTFYNTLEALNAFPTKPDNLADTG